MSDSTLQLLISLIGVALSALVSALSAFYGAKISIARVEEKITAQNHQIEDLKRRVDRLESPHFGKDR